MRAARCLQAATDLLRPHMALAAAGEPSLLQRIQSSLFCSTSSSHSSSFSTLAQGSSAAQSTVDALQQHQHIELASFSARGYARAARSAGSGSHILGRSKRRDGRAPHTDLSQLQLGRSAVQCLPTEQLREPYYPEQYDPWKDTRREVMQPIMVSKGY